MRHGGTVILPFSLTDPGGLIPIPGALGGPLKEGHTPGSLLTLRTVTGPLTAAISGIVVPPSGLILGPLSTDNRGTIQKDATGGIHEGPLGIGWVRQFHPVLHAAVLAILAFQEDGVDELAR